MMIHGQSLAKGRPARRFGVIDAMILVAATAAGLAWGRRDLAAIYDGSAWVRIISVSIDPPEPFTLNSHRHMRFITQPVSFADWLSIFTGGASRILACWTVAALVIRLRPPRPRRARMLCQPGTLAVATATAYQAAVAASYLLVLLIHSEHRPRWWVYAEQVIDPPVTAHAIMAAWILLLLSGRWRVEPSWPDRLGRVIGLAWIVLMVAGYFSLR